MMIQTQSPNDNHYYKTKDWIEASLLFAFDIPFEGVDRNGQTCYFLFSDQLRAEEIIECYWRGDLNGNLRAFAYAPRRIKDCIHRGHGNEYRRTDRP